MEFDNSTPIYFQIVQLIKTEIATKKISPGKKLLSAREYSLELKVNPNTMARVFKELENEGITFTQRGLGTFVTEDKEIINNLRSQLVESAVEKFIKEIEILKVSKIEIEKILKVRGVISE